jgi:putative phosphoserine phosphatase/1-acylglycerol-3-phosphate O-acyltransferase
VAFFVAFAIAGCLMLLFLVAPAYARKRQTAWVHAWGRTILAIFGVKVEVHGARQRTAPGAALIFFNHVSLLDLMVLSTEWADDATVVYKQEFHRVPVIGSVMKRLDLIPIDRTDREAAVASMRAAARQVQERGAKVFIAPEGTRSRRGGLQEFKLGPFHLAAETGAPIVPAVLRGIGALNPVGSWLIRAGTVRLDYLEPIPTSGWRAEDVRARAEEVREVFLRYLPAAVTGSR